MRISGIWGDAILMEDHAPIKIPYVRIGKKIDLLDRDALIASGKTGS